MNRILLWKYYLTIPYLELRTLCFYSQVNIQNMGAESKLSVGLHPQTQVLTIKFITRLVGKS